MDYEKTYDEVMHIDECMNERDDDTQAHGVNDTKPCSRCRGKGHYMVANGPDDVQHEICDDCDGKGIL